MERLPPERLLLLRDELELRPLLLLPRFEVRLPEELRFDERLFDLEDCMMKLQSLSGRRSTGPPGGDANCRNLRRAVTLQQQIAIHVKAV